jgi:hypothetical protein
MNNSLTKKLKESHPVLFEYFNSTDPDIRWPIVSGITCGRGWFTLINELCSRIDLLDSEREIRVLQIKEKFGGLRFYVSKSIPEIDSLISEYEHKSYNICEFCGSSNDLKRSKGWIKVACRECRENNSFLRRSKW